MHLHDFDGRTLVNSEAVLAARLSSIRRGDYGAFWLHHENEYPALSVQLNRDLAYLHYFPSAEHPGYQPCGMTPNGCKGDVHFLQIDGSEGDSIDMPDYVLVDAEAAYTAAFEFYRSTDIPRSIQWSEL